MGAETGCEIGEAKDMRSMDRSIAWWYEVLRGGRSARDFMIGVWCRSVGVLRGKEREEDYHKCGCDYGNVFES